MDAGEIKWKEMEVNGKIIERGIREGELFPTTFHTIHIGPSMTGDSQNSRKIYAWEATNTCQSIYPMR